MRTTERLRLLPERIGLVASLLLFGIPAVLLWISTGLLIPPPVRSGWAPQTAWFLAGSFVFVPLLLAALAGAAAALPAPSLPKVLEHLRLRRMTPADWRLAGVVLLFIGLATAAMYFVNASVWPRLPSQPPFLPASALEPSQYYILLPWLPFFAVTGPARFELGNLIPPTQHVARGQKISLDKASRRAPYSVSGSGVAST